MLNTIREYDAKLDAKHRLTLQGVSFEYYHVSEYDDGRILLEPREPATLFHISSNTLEMMDKTVHNMNEGKISDALDLSEFVE